MSRFLRLTIPCDRVRAQATTDPAIYTAPGTSLSVGTFFDSDPSSVATDFTAMVTWIDTSTTQATVAQVRPGLFGAYVSAAPNSTDAANYTLVISNDHTGVSNSQQVGAGAPNVAPTRPVAMPFHHRPKTPANPIASMVGGSKSAPSGSQGFLSGGTLPSSEELSWDTTPGLYYWVYYRWSKTSAIPTQATRYNSVAFKATSDSYTVTIPGSQLEGPGLSTDSAYYGNYGATYYFTVVQTNNSKPPHINKKGQPTTGKASDQFCAPLIFLIAGGGDGDSGAPGAAAVAAKPTAAFYDAYFGAQTITFPWNQPPTAGILPTKVPAILMGHSFGGGAAVGVANNPNVTGGTSRTTPFYLDLWDPVAPYPPDIVPALLPGNHIFNVPGADQNTNYGGNEYSSFDLPTDKTITFAYDFWAEYSTEAANGGAGYPTGFINSGRSGGYYSYEMPWTTAPNPPANPWTQGLTHVSQEYNPDLLTYGIGWQFLTPWTF